MLERLSTSAVLVSAGSVNAYLKFKPAVSLRYSVA